MSIRVENNQGAKIWSERLRRMSIRAEHARPFFQYEMIPDMERIEDQLFVSQGRRGGGSWKGLSPDYLRRKMRSGLDPRINIATGTMLASLVNEDMPYAVREITDFKLVFGSRAPGVEQSQKYRPVMKFTKYDRRRWAQWWAEYITMRFGKRV